MERHFKWQDNGLDRHRRYIGLLAAAGFAVGIIAANTFGRSSITRMGLFGDYFWMQLEQIRIDTGTMFWYVFEKRMLFLLIILLFGVTSFGSTLVYLAASWVGCSIGFLLSAAVMQRGAGGLFLCVMGFIPHGLFYLPAGFLMLVKTCRLSDRLHGRDKSGIFHRKKELSAYAVMMGVVLAVFFLGIVLESMLNPVLLQKIYRIFNNI